MERQPNGGEQPDQQSITAGDEQHEYPHGLGSRYAPTTVPGANLSREAMAEVNEDDWIELHSLAQRYCLTVDATRSRKRMDGSATITRDGFAAYGTDDISDDVTQDAALLYAQRLGTITAACQPASADEVSGAADAWKYTRKDGTQTIVSRETIRYWAVRDAAARNGYRHDRQDAANDAHRWQVAAHIAMNEAVAQQNDATWQAAFGDGSEFPTLRELLPRAEQAADLGRAGVLSATAQAIHGGVYGSSGHLRKTKEAALQEWRELAARLDEVRDDVVYRAGQPRFRTTNRRYQGQAQ